MCVYVLCVLCASSSTTAAIYRIQTSLSCSSLLTFPTERLSLRLPLPSTHALTTPLHRQAHSLQGHKRLPQAIRAARESRDLFHTLQDGKLECVVIDILERLLVRAGSLQGKDKLYQESLLLLKRKLEILTPPEEEDDAGNLGKLGGESKADGGAGEGGLAAGEGGGDGSMDAAALQDNRDKIAATQERLKLVETLRVELLLGSGKLHSYTPQFFKVVPNSASRELQELQLEWDERHRMTRSNPMLQLHYRDVPFTAVKQRARDGQSSLGQLVGFLQECTAAHKAQARALHGATQNQTSLLGGVTHKASFNEVGMLQKSMEALAGSVVTQSNALARLSNDMMGLSGSLNNVARFETSINDKLRGHAAAKEKEATKAKQRFEDNTAKFNHARRVEADARDKINQVRRMGGGRRRRGRVCCCVLLCVVMCSVYCCCALC